MNIDPSAQVIHSIIGPHVTLAAGCRVENSIVRDSIIDEGAEIKAAMLTGSLVGKEAHVSSRFRVFNVGDSSEVGFE